MQLYFYNGQPTNYGVSEDGRVFNYSTKKFLKGQKGKNGYWSCNLSLPGAKKRLYIHRMMMESYCPNSNSSSLEVNHKDGNKDNNTLSNLEWCTTKENHQHAFENYLNGSRPIFGFDDNKQLAIEFRSQMDAVRLMGWNQPGLSAACTMQKKIKFHGYYWSFSSDNNFEIGEAENHGKSKAVDQYDLNGKLIASFPSMAAAARANNCSRPHIGEACNGKLRTYAGYIWKYQTNL